MNKEVLRSLTDPTVKKDENLVSELKEIIKNLVGFSKEEVEELVGSWNGKDSFFFYRGEVYTEDEVDVYEYYLKLGVYD